MVGLLVGFAQLLVAEDFRLVSAERHEILKSHIPDSNDGVLARIRIDPRLIIYTEKEMPKAYQDFAGALPGIHSPSYNISADKPRELYGNPNVEFPWGSPAGAELVPDEYFSTFKFLLLPKDRSIRISRKYLPGDSRPSYTWTFPDGAVVGEVLQLYHKERYYTFEVRVRNKSEGRWRVASYRPFDNFEKFKAFCVLNGESVKVETHRVRQSHQLFEGDVETTMLGSISEDLVKKALSRTFTNVHGKEWVAGAYAPTTNEAFHIVPKRFQAATVEVGSKSCMRCHESTLKHASDFDFRRDWYGRVRGSDGVFSFHPFDPSCISYSGIYQGETIRKSFLDAGIVTME